ncbi:hypothetical protein Aperf_G00000123650 [Anoplocephala perfoliata]
MSGTIGSSNSSTPFVLRGSSPIFSQRQQNAFGCLQALEEAHDKVTKESKAERNLVKKMAWRPAKPAAESLEAEKAARDKQKASNSDPANLFKVPLRPAPSLRKRIAYRQQYTSERFPGDSRREHTKWIHYNLADVDEDAGLGGQANRRIAADLMLLLRRRRQEREGIQNEEPSGENPPLGRILFRPTTGRKKRCLDSMIDSTDTSLSSRFSSEDELAGDEDAHAEVDASNHSEAVHFRSRQHAGRSTRYVTASDDHSDEEMDVSENGSTSMASAEGEPDTSSDESEFTDLEDAPEGL